MGSSKRRFKIKMRTRAQNDREGTYRSSRHAGGKETGPLSLEAWSREEIKEMGARSLWVEEARCSECNRIGM